MNKVYEFKKSLIAMETEATKTADIDFSTRECRSNQPVFLQELIGSYQTRSIVPRRATVLAAYV